MSTTEPQAQARIYDQSYRPFAGPLANVHSRYFVIALNEFRQAWKEKWFRRVAIAAFFPLGVFGVMTVISARVQGLNELADVWKQFWGSQSFFAMLVTFYLGRNAVAEDLRTGALNLYFSRPVSFQQYVLGKWLAIAMGVAAVTLLPGLVLALFRWLIEPGVSWVTFAGWVGALCVLTGLLCLVNGSVMLAISSLAGRGRTAGIVWVMAYFLTVALGQGLVEATGSSALEFIGFGQANTRLAEMLLGVEALGRLTLWAMVAHLAWLLVALGVLTFRLRRWKGN